MHFGFSFPCLCYLYFYVFVSNFSVIIIALLQISAYTVLHINSIHAWYKLKSSAFKNCAAYLCCKNYGFLINWKCPWALYLVTRNPHLPTRPTSGMEKTGKSKCKWMLSWRRCPIYFAKTQHPAVCLWKLSERSAINMRIWQNEYLVIL